MSKASWKVSTIAIIAVMSVIRFQRLWGGAETASKEEQVLIAHISHLLVELRQRLAARQLTGRLSIARQQNSVNPGVFRSSHAEQPQAVFAGNGALILNGQPGLSTATSGTGSSNAAAQVWTLVTRHIANALARRAG
jgi:hypothetical protein